ncbi:MAG: flagellar protein FliS, partial [Gammaproteobacteria bacterium]|nr:flagellar protein FliS [Gammaproteobacteria bacterium]
MIQRPESDFYNQVMTADDQEPVASHRLIQMLMEGALERLHEAKIALARGDSRLQSELLIKTVAIIGGLRESLDLELGGEIAQNLDDLYDY